MGNNNFLGLPMFKDKKNATCVNKIIQCNFASDTTRNVLDSVGEILIMLSKEIKPYVSDGQDLKPEIKTVNSYPYASIEMDNLVSGFGKDGKNIYRGNLDGFKLNDILFWTKWKSETKNSYIIKFTEEYMKLIKVQSLIRLACLYVYEMPISNLIDTPIFTEKSKFKPLQTTFEIQYKDYLIKIVTTKVNKKQLKIFWDISYNKLLKLKDYEKVLSDMLSNKNLDMFKFFEK